MQWKCEFRVFVHIRREKRPAKQLQFNLWWFGARNAARRRIFSAERAPIPQENKKVS